MDVLKEYFSKALLILLLAITASEGQNNVCLNHAMGEFVANPLDCKKFYLCGLNGEAVPASCPPNMLFNPVSKICDTQSNVRCEATTTLAPPPATTQVTTTVSPIASVVDYCLNLYTQQPSADALIFVAHPSSCHQYYMCYYGQALLQECSTDLQWNSRIGKCDLPSNAKCHKEDGNMPVPVAPTESPSIGNANGIVCPVYGQHIFPHMQRCDFFIYCVKGHAILQQCPFYQYFDVESSRCKWRKVALCIKDLKLVFRLIILLLAVPFLSAFKYVAKPRLTDFCLGHEWGEFVANPNDCKLFFLCGKNGEGVVASCPPNMLFNDQTKLCDNAENVECEEVALAEEEALPIATFTTKAPSMITTTTTTVRPPKADQYCYNLYAMQSKKYTLVFLPHPGNCQQYYMCYHGKALLQSCSPRLNWNSKLGKCDLPSNAECVITKNEEDYDEEDEVLTSLEEPIWGNSVKCPLYGEHIFPHTQRCDSFIFCVKGQSLLQSCPFYQHFDVESARCKWRHKATCVKDLNLEYQDKN
ncbi:uncharacterized protein LOC119613456 [Lucilia sericata]|uniref:uncharacterized protein LOC119613456 n=1 Tax=Lucilia sericata TaxID=13632 RepID=UPI0018A87645|nr:uncharacterized protein LOC119613456 [Lucilia sericata]